jgi:hypothetical protein
MVCFVHDRQFLSKFHAIINKIRQAHEFTVGTLRQLPKRCCSCPEKRNDMVSTGIQSPLTSLDIDVMRLICLQLDLKQYITTNDNVLPPSSKNHDYTNLSFPTSFKSKKQTIIANQFIFQQDNQLQLLQQMHHVRLEFVRSTSSEELLKDVAQWQYTLVAKSSNYLEATQAINGLWVIISAEVQSHIDIVKHVLQKQWKRFINNINIDSTYTVCNGRRIFLPQVKIGKCFSLQRSEIKHQKMLNKQEAKRQVKQEKKEAKRQIRVLQVGKASLDDSEDDREDAVEDLVENALVSTQLRLQFLTNRFQNCNKSKQPRTHRRQHIMALAMVA